MVRHLASSLLVFVAACQTAVPSPDAAQIEPPVARDVAAPTPVANFAAWRSVPGAESVVWYTTAAGGTESAWIRERDDGYEVVATRPGVVMSDGRTLWTTRVAERELRSQLRDGQLRTYALDLELFDLKHPDVTWGTIDDQRLRADERFDDLPTIAGSLGPEFVLRLGAGEHDEVAHTLVTVTDDRTCARVDRCAAPRCGDRLEEGSRAGMAAQLGALAAALAGAPPNASDPVMAALASSPDGFTRGVLRALKERAAPGPMGFSRLAFTSPAERQCASDGFASAVPKGNSPELVALWVKGTQAANHDAPADAMTAFEALVTRSPELARGWLGRGHMRRVAMDWVGAQSDFEQALRLETRPELRADLHVELGLLNEARGDRTKAAEHYRSALHIEPYSDLARAKLDALGLVAVVYSSVGEYVTSRWVASGFPATNHDGSRVVFVEYYDGGMSDVSAARLVVRETLTNKVVASLQMYTFEEAVRGDPNAPALLDRSTTRARAITEALAKETWHSLVALEAPFDFGYETVDDERPFFTRDGELLVTYQDPTLGLDLRDGATAFKRRVSLQRERKNCVNQAGLDTAYADVARGVVLLMFRYAGTDMCLEPNSVWLATRIPRGRALAGWSTTGRPGSPPWLATLAEALRSSEANAPLSGELRAEYERFVALWSQRYPTSPSVRKARAALDVR